MNKKLLKITALFVSVSLVALFIAYRSGAFDKKKNFTTPVAKSETKQNDSFNVRLDTLPITEINGVKKDSFLTLLKDAGLRFDYSKIDINSLLKNSKPSNDTTIIEMPDSLFLLNDSLVFSDNNITTRDSFEMKVREFILQKWQNEKMRVPSTKYMPIFNRTIDFISLNNLKFNYKKVIQYDKISSYKFYHPPKKIDSFYIDPDEMMLSSKSGYIISKKDFKKDSLPLKRKDTLKLNDSVQKQPLRIGSSKSRVIVEKNDFKKN